MTIQFKNKDDILYENDIITTVENDIISSVDIRVIARFDNMSEFIINLKENRFKLNGAHSNKLANIIKMFVETFNLLENDGLYLSTIKNIPCRVIKQDGEVLAIGHFMQEKYFYDDLIYEIINN